MNRESKMWLRAVPASVLAIGVVCLVGCRTTGYMKSDAAAANSQVAALEIQAESRELEATMAALNDLVNQPATDAKPQFLRFSAALDRLADSSERATSRVNRMGQKRAAYFQVWDKEIAAIEDEEIRSRSQARKVEVNTQFDSASRQYDEAQNGLKPLISYLRDVRKALSTDLTKDGLVAARSSASNAAERAPKVQAALTQSATELDTLSARMSSFRVQDVQ